MILKVREQDYIMLYRCGRQTVKGDRGDFQIPTRKKKQLMNWVNV